MRCTFNIDFKKFQCMTEQTCHMKHQIFLCRTYLRSQKNLGKYCINPTTTARDDIDTINWARQ